MARRPFRLQALLDHKRQLEEQRMLHLAECEAEWRQACEVLAMLRDAERDQLRDLEQIARASRLDVAQQRDATSYLQRLEVSMRAQGEVIADAERRVLESRDALVEILKEKRSLERLREQHVAETEREEGRREAGVVDEITSARYVRLLQGRA